MGQPDPQMMIQQAAQQGAQQAPKKSLGLRSPMIFQAGQLGPDAMVIIARQLAQKAPARGKAGWVERPMWGQKSLVGAGQLPNPVQPPMMPAMQPHPGPQLAPQLPGPMAVPPLGEL